MSTCWPTRTDRQCQSPHRPPSLFLLRNFLETISHRTKERSRGSASTGLRIESQKERDVDCDTQDDNDETEVAPDYTRIRQESLFQLPQVSLGQFSCTSTCNRATTSCRQHLGVESPNHHAF